MAPETLVDSNWWSTDSLASDVSEGTVTPVPAASSEKLDIAKLQLFGELTKTALLVGGQLGAKALQPSEPLQQKQFMVTPPPAASVSGGSWFSSITPGQVVVGVVVIGGIAWWVMRDRDDRRRR